MPVVPTGPMGQMLDAFCSLIASATTFQSEVNAASEALAKPRAYAFWRGGSGALAYQRPFALAGINDATIDWGTFVTGQIFMMFQREIPAQYIKTPGDDVQDFLNVMDAIIQEMLANAYDSTQARPQVQRYGVKTTGPQRSKTVEDVHYFEQFFTFQVGLRVAG